MLQFLNRNQKMSRAFIGLMVALVVVTTLLQVLPAYAADGSQSLSSSSAQQPLTTGQSASGIQKVTNAVAAVIVGDAPASSQEAQTIAVVLNNEKAQISSASISLTRLSDNKVFTSSKVNASGNLAVFSVDGLAEGSYYTSAITFAFTNEITRYQQSFPMDEANVFTISSNPTEFSLGNVDVTVYDLDANDELSSDTAVANKVENAVNIALETGVTSSSVSQAPAQTQTESASGPVSTKASASGSPLSYTFVIALDPGHGGDDKGASGNGLIERDINLSIAKACKVELEKYQNIKVYMTRTSNTTFVGLNERVVNAKRNGARVFVSIHINAAESASANGTEVYYPINSSYLKNQTHGMGKEVAQNVLDELLGLGLGLSNRGIKTRMNTVNDTYADGSQSDYYSVIRNSRSQGIPGLIIEHAFITNTHDANILSKSANLTKMGKADALGIAKAYNFATGYWYDDNGVWKYWEGSRYSTSKWLYRAGTWYYFDSTSKPVRGIQKLDGVYYYFDKTTFANKGGWILDGGKWYYGRSDNAVWESWSLKPGWLRLDAWYYFDPSVKGYPAKTGLFTVDGVKYYTDDNCRLVTNKTITVGGKTYSASSSGALTEVGSSAIVKATDNKMKGKTGWIKDSLGWHYYKNGVSQSGWIYLDAWYYLDPKAAGHPAKTGFFSDGKARYYAYSGSCKMATGWIKVSDKWYYANANGALASGWKKLGGYWYYLDPAQTNHPALTGLFKADGVQYYADSDCRLVVSKTVTVSGTTYKANSSGALTVVGKVASVTTAGDYDIMGKPGTTVAKMVAAYNKTGKSYPASTYKSKGAATINVFCQILYDEAVAEGVRPEVVFAQSMLETGWLQFGGDVKASQCNFAGLGATGGGAQGATFKDVRTGLRAQVQHLKAYASTKALNNTCVDPRFDLVKRGCATTVIHLGQQENPNGYGWATGKGYGSNIIKLMKDNKII